MRPRVPPCLHAKGLDAHARPREKHVVQGLAVGGAGVLLKEKRAHLGSLALASLAEALYVSHLRHHTCRHGGRGGGGGARQANGRESKGTLPKDPRILQMLFCSPISTCAVPSLDWNGL